MWLAVLLVGIFLLGCVTGGFLVFGAHQSAFKPHVHIDREEAGWA